MGRCKQDPKCPTELIAIIINDSTVYCVLSSAFSLRVTAKKSDLDSTLCSNLLSNRADYFNANLVSTIVAGRYFLQWNLKR